MFVLWTLSTSDLDIEFLRSLLWGILHYSEIRSLKDIKPTNRSLLGKLYEVRKMKLQFYLLVKPLRRHRIDSITVDHAERNAPD